MIHSQLNLVVFSFVFPRFPQLLLFVAFSKENLYSVHILFKLCKHVDHIDFVLLYFLLNNKKKKTYNYITLLINKAIFECICT